MEITDELRELLRKHYEETNTKCINCSHKCYLSVLVSFIHENGYEYFDYLWTNNSLPKPVKIALARLLNTVGVEKAAKSNVIFHFCNIS